jgi:putative phosphoesterase
MKITLLSDTHSFFDPQWETLWSGSDEVWHSGDFGSVDVIDRIQETKYLRGVWGNIDGKDIRIQVPEFQLFEVNDLKVLMLHIGGYPDRYVARARELITTHLPGLFICGHSHILKVIYDHKYQMLTMNPGAAGKTGWHKIRTMIRFEIDDGKVHSAEVIELGKR